nr:DNA adenine methylase [uncultured Campylobacter sp.]
MASGEKREFLSEQLISYLGNKRSLLAPIERAICEIKAELGRDKISFADVFSGSGIVARLVKAHSNLVIANDLEGYSRAINSCYLSNFSDELWRDLTELHAEILRNFTPKESFFSELYAPKNDENIKAGERAFYTRRNALILGGLCEQIGKIPQKFRDFFTAPLLSEASIHSNTGGVFKGFYKDKAGVGKFGGSGENALARIMGEISLRLPVLSNFACESAIFQEDAAHFAQSARKRFSQLDVAYFDPPYNQHPYGSNYFMLNLITDFINEGKRPNVAGLSRVSGIPTGWNRSAYNKKSSAAEEFFALLAKFPAKFLIISFNSEGFISKAEFLKNLAQIGSVRTIEIRYPTYRASRNLNARELYVTEFLYVVQK